MIFVIVLLLFGLTNFYGFISIPGVYNFFCLHFCTLHSFILYFH